MCEGLRAERASFQPLWLRTQATSFSPLKTTASVELQVRLTLVAIKQRVRALRHQTVAALSCAAGT